MALVATGAEDDFREQLFSVFRMNSNPGQVPKRQPAQSFFEVAGVDRNRQVQGADCKDNICAAMASIKLSY
jgi:hypothetical protein